MTCPTLLEWDLRTPTRGVANRRSFSEGGHANIASPIPKNPTPDEGGDTLEKIADDNEVECVLRRDRRRARPRPCRCRGGLSSCYSERVLEPSLLLPERPRPLKRSEYDRLVAMGAFDDERVELLYGTLVAMSPQDPGHTSPIGRLNMLLVPALVGRALIRVQSPFIAADESEPEPDLAIVPLGDYRKAHPDRAHLLIEVAVSSAKKDRLVKAPLYARSGVDEYWLVDVANGRIEVYRDPSAGGYLRMADHGPGAKVVVEAFPDVAVRVDDVFS
jgi:Uma2 family endonuclease